MTAANPARSLAALILIAISFLSSVTLAKPNVVFIIVDDLNDMPYQPDGKPLVPTPNIDRLKAQGVTFNNAHTNDPLCAPSRASMIFGLYPQTTSLYWFENWKDNGIYRESVSLHDNLRRGGYGVYGTGKIYHGGQNGLFDEFGVIGDVGPWPWDGQSDNFRLPHPQQLYLYEGEDADMDYKWEHVFGPLSDIPVWPADPANEIPGYKGWRLFGKPWRYADDDDRDPLADELGAKWSAEVIQRNHDKPFALFTGLIRTHTPLYAPKNYFDRFPLDSIELPTVDPNDLDDVSSALGNEELYGFRRYKMLVKHEGKDLFRRWLQAYMACVSFVDDQVGTILDAVNSSPYRDNTIIFFTSDHGFHVGEKDFLYKGSLWEPSTRVPLIVAGVPGGAKGATSDQPVSLIDIYPTFNELLGLNQNPNAGTNGYELEGHSLVPLIKDPEKGQWSGPEVAITTIPGKNHMQHQIYEGTLYPHFSVRGKRWRYSLASDGGEELYDHKNDPFEWRNLANNPEYSVVKANLKNQLVELRDGDRWQSLESLDTWNPGGNGISERHGEIRIADRSRSELSTAETFDHFEFEVDVKMEAKTRLGIAYREGVRPKIESPKSESEAAEHSVFHFGEWNRYRFRVHNGRHQLWINNRYVSDEVRETVESSGPVSIRRLGGEGDIRIRNARVREL